MAPYSHSPDPTMLLLLPSRMPRRDFLRLLSTAAVPAAFVLAYAAPAAAQNQAPLCSICQNRVAGRFQEYTLENGRLYRVCGTCSRTMPRCHACNVPAQPRWLQEYPDRTRWCSACVAKTDLCTACRSPIRGTYYTLTYTEGIWCARCYRNSPKCDLCQAPATGPVTHLPDGRRICRSCSSDTVRGTAAIQRIYNEIRPTIVFFLGRDFEDVPIAAADLNQMTRVLDEARQRGVHIHGPRRSGDRTVNELGIYVNFDNRPRILILDAIPVDLAYETVAHEVAHAWQAQHFPNVTEPVLVEGFAQWVAEHVCYTHDRRSGLEKIRERDDLYGRGFRVIRNIENMGGRDAVFQALRENRPQ